MGTQSTWGLQFCFPNKKHLKKKKMSRVSLFLVLVCFTAWFSSGSARDCLVCTGGLHPGWCGENESGTSKTCPEDGAKCGKADCEVDGQTVIIRDCALAIAPDEDTCVEVNGENSCHQCTCNSDNCNYATKAQISAISILAVIFVSMLTQ